MKPTRLCVISGKESWQDSDGNWYSNGGFPLQMRAIGSLFDQMTLAVTRRPAPGPGGIRLPENANVVVLRSPAGADLRRKISVALQLPHYFSTILALVRDADAVHVPPPGDLPVLGMAAALLLRKRLIVRYCGSWRATARTTWGNRITRGCMRLFSGGRNVMLATGESSSPPALGVEWIFSTALSAAELNRVVPDCQRGLSSPPRLVYIGRLHFEKGVANLIEGIARLKQRGVSPLPKVTLIGDGPERQPLTERARRLGCLPHVEFKGQLDREALAQELVHADLCVQPSLTEGFSKAWLDAFAYGLPVLATDAGAARHVIGRDGERGWVIAPGDVTALADKLQEVLSAPTDWPALRQRARRYVESRTLEAWAGTIGEICSRQWNVPFTGGKLCFNAAEPAIACVAVSR